MAWDQAGGAARGLLDGLRPLWPPGAEGPPRGCKPEKNSWMG